jgi:hypothetical protein
MSVNMRTSCTKGKRERSKSAHAGLSVSIVQYIDTPHVSFNDDRGNRGPKQEYIKET